MIQIPKSKCPFGLSSQQFEGDEVAKHSLNLSLGGTSENNIAFREWIEQMDKKILEKAVEQSPSWMGKQKSSAVMEELYKPMVIHSKDGQYAPTMKFKFMTNKNGEFQAPVYLNQEDTASPKDIVKGSSVSLIAQLNSLWFVGKQFGVTWIVHQVKLYPAMSLTAYAFAPEDDDEEEEIGDDEYEEEVEEEVE